MMWKIKLPLYAAFILIALFIKKEAKGQTNAEMEDIAVDVLDGISSMGWDPENQGIYINWHRVNFQLINCTGGGDADQRDTPTRHDAQNDIRALQHYYWWKWLNNGDTRYDAAIARLLPTVKAKYRASSSEKGWMYYVFLRLHQYADTQEERDFWRDVILQWAPKMASKIDPVLGVIYQNSLGNCDCGSKTIYLDKAYRVGHNVQMGAALVDAGSRFNNPTWVSKGHALTMQAYEHAFVESYGLFGRIYLISDAVYGNNKLWDTQAKLGEASETIDALIRAASVTTNAQAKADFNMIAVKMLNALRDQPVHDKSINGGYYAAQYVGVNHDGKSEVSKDNKEMRQGSLLGTFVLANRLLSPANQWLDLENEMKRVVCRTSTDPQPGMYLRNIPDPGGTYNGYRRTIAGWTFDMNPDWTIAGNIPGGKNWVSNESNSLCLLGILQYLTDKPDNGIPAYELTTAATGAGTIAINLPGSVYDAGTELTITAIPQEGYLFNGWGGNLSGLTNPATITMDSYKTVTANFISEERAAALLTNLSVKDAANASDWALRSNFQQNDLIYGDRDYRIKTLPAAYAGLEWISPANDSKSSNQDPLITFTVSRNADLYVAFNHNNGAIPKPSWLSGWDTTTDNIVSSSSSTTYTVYKKSFIGGSFVSLGPNNTSKDTYFVMAKETSSLPLTLLSFHTVLNLRLNKKEVKVIWKTVNEKNTKNFSIERSIDGKNFEPVGNVSSYNAGGIHSYSFTDITPPPGTLYYRLKQVDQDGEYTYSKEVSVYNQPETYLSVYPNPTAGNITISHDAAKPGTYLSIIGLDGKKVLEQPLDKGTVKTELNIYEWPAGLYIIELKNGTEKSIIRFLKK